MIVYLDDKRKDIAVEFPYDEVLVARVRAIPGGKWDPSSRTWRFPAAGLDHLVAALPRALYMGELHERAREVQRAAFTQHLQDAPQPEGLEFQLYPFQRAGVKALGELTGAILADEMGLGKTVQALALVHTKKLARTLVICGAGVKLTWADHVERVLPGVRCHVLSSLSSVKYAASRPGVQIINYERLSRGGDKYVEEFQKGLPIDLLVLDEAHRIKNRDAKRTQASLAIAFGSERCLAMTGTPVQNRPEELFNILVSIKKLRPNDWWKFAQRFCGLVKGPFGWDASGASNLPELHAMIRPYLIRRLKADVLPELPPKQYTDWKVEIDDPDYKAEVRRLRSAYASGADARDVAGGLFRLRQLAAISKVELVLERLEEQDGQSIVFCSYLEPLRRLHEKLGHDSALMTGEVPPAERQVRMEAFQRGDVRVALCSTMAMGEGVTLTAAEEVLFMDLPWTPAAKAQAEDRAHRIGQEKKLSVVHMIASGTVDEAQMKLIGEKAAMADTVTDGEILNELARRLLKLEPLPDKEKLF